MKLRISLSNTKVDKQLLSEENAGHSTRQEVVHAYSSDGDYLGDASGAKKLYEKSTSNAISEEQTIKNIVGLPLLSEEKGLYTFQAVNLRPSFFGNVFARLRETFGERITTMIKPGQLVVVLRPGHLKRVK